ncbi:transglutaminase-like cysteine peptidase [Pseudoteredinibacter isoporae]|uniref:Putative transglutaminase-like cysteine proteinase n=1 Tax=Pseudoteredinibacter isoporae TaxID=570281 RepID=A0A7X0MXF4_9GAMM|nr:transglutaminase-like cysteine peptidase [Pseudoteredinibacter isoporae]MBB6520862.1 putative transglutaminase-like cysteine proteinase [Pseudoteredinibacter isoporae]NHO86427.1 hypothetical protein [Pseudoteredinibacter isoporae]NIB25121.1 hypothetical protein [Pseudoteredinibacter isoporae]
MRQFFSRTTHLHIVISCLFLLNCQLGNAQPQNLSTSILRAQNLENQGISALNDWANMVETLRNPRTDSLQQLSTINQYFNRFSWRSDRQRWQSDDHWSSSFDTIRKQQGDCEDLSIAKFSTLLALGFKEEQLQLHYVFSRAIKSSHMVVSVRLDNGQEVLLDSLSDSLKSMAERTDLQAIYSFNRDGLWIPKLSRDKRSLSLIPSWERLLKDDPILRNPELLSQQFASL